MRHGLGAGRMSQFSPEVQEILDRVKSGRPKPPPEPRQPKPKPPKPVRKRTPKPPKPRAEKRPTHDHERIRALFEEGKRVGEIAIAVNAHRSTVRRALVKMGLGVDASGKFNGPPRSEKCRKGLHDMSVHGRPVKTKDGINGRYCRACKTERELRVRQVARLAAQTT